MGEFKIREEKPKIAIDVDGTLAKTMEALLESFNKENNTNYTINDINDWNKGVLKVFGGYKKFLKMFNEFWEKRREEISPYITKELLEELSKYYEIVIVSNRGNKRHEKFIQEWLKENFGLEFKVVLVKDILDKINNGDYNLIIDDAPILAKEIVKNNNNQYKKLILVERPWNKKVSEEIKNENVICVKSTEEAIKLAITLREKEKAMEKTTIKNSL